MLIDNEPIYDSRIVVTRYYTTANTNPTLSNLKTFCSNRPASVDLYGVFLLPRRTIYQRMFTHTEPFRWLPIGEDLC